MITREELILIGHYNKPHGVNGEISATLDIDSEALQGLSCLVSDMNGIFVPFYVDACRPKNHETVLLMIDGMDTERAVRAVANYVRALQEQLEYTLTTLDSDNVIEIDTDRTAVAGGLTLDGGSWN